MKTIEIALYDFSELSEKSQQYALELYKCTKDYDINSDIIISDINLSWSIAKELIYNNINYNLNISGLNLRKYILNNLYDILYRPKYLGSIKGKQIYSKINISNDCVLTGTYTDEIVLKSIYDFLNRTDYKSNTYNNIRFYNLYNWAEYDVESFIENTINNKENLKDWLNNYCIENNIMFHEDGTLFKINN